MTGDLRGGMFLLPSTQIGLLTVRWRNNWQKTVVIGKSKWLVEPRLALE